MRTHTEAFKTNIGLYGRQIESKLIYDYIDNADGTQTEVYLTNEELFSLEFITTSSLLTSVMKQMNFEASQSIDIGKSVEYKFYVDGEEVNLGSYIIKEKEYKEDTQSYTYVAYDKMLYSMVNYNGIENTFPMTLKAYIQALCDDINLELATDTFTNYDKILTSDPYISTTTDETGTTTIESLGYTYRDIFDEVSEATASNLCINADNKLEVRYIFNSVDTIDGTYLKESNVNFTKKYGPISEVVLTRNDTDSVSKKDETLEECAVQIKDNQIMNGDNRENYLEEIYNKLHNLEFYIFDVESTGIAYLEACDRVTIETNDNSYSCVIFNDDLQITQGISEKLYADEPTTAEETYTTGNESEKTTNKISTLILDKTNQTLTSTLTEYDKTIKSYIGSEIQASASGITAKISAITNDDGEVDKVVTETVTIDKDGIQVATDDSEVSTLMSNKSFEIKTNGETVMSIDANGGSMDNLTVKTYFTAGYHKVIKMENGRTGWFYNGGE